MSNIDPNLLKISSETNKPKKYPDPDLDKLLQMGQVSGRVLKVVYINASGSKRNLGGDKGII